MSSEVCAKQAAVRPGDQYQEFLEVIQKQFHTVSSAGPLFQTAASDVWEAFLDGFPEEWRQYFNCSACRKFVRNYGGLVSLGSFGEATSAVWRPDTVPDLYKESVRRAAQIVLDSSVTGVFYSAHSQLGTPTTGAWSHMAVCRERKHCWNKLQPAHAAMAEKHEEHNMLKRTLAEFVPSTVQDAVQILKSDALYRGDRILGMAEWLLNTMELLKYRSSRARNRLLWRAVALAPAGFCHVRSSMIGTLLDDLKDGLNFDAAAARFREKMNPLQYQRPQALPKAGAIKMAEQVVQASGIRESLKRRYARLEELQTIWKPKGSEEKQSDDRVFKAVKARGSTKMSYEIPVVAISFRKFWKTVLPLAESIEYVPDREGDYVAFLTAVDPDAPPILQWDSLKRRNPVSWYRYAYGSLSEDWNLIQNRPVKVLAVVLKPSMWKAGCEHQGKCAVFVLEGCKDTKLPGLGLFPEILRSEYHGIRGVIEEYSKMGTPEGKEFAACGIGVGSNPVAGVFKVTAGSVVSSYRFDRWD